MRKAGWSQPEISKALAVKQKTLGNWLIVANFEANDTQPLSIMAKNSSIVISHNNRGHTNFQALDIEKAPSYDMCDKPALRC